MKILVTGATGNVGGGVVKNLLKRGVEIRALVRKPEAAKFPFGVEVVAGDQTDPGSIRSAVKGVDKLFLLNAVVADELTQALITYGIAKRAGVERGFASTEADVSRVTKLLGHAPRMYEAFVQETTAEWSKNEQR